MLQPIRPQDAGQIYQRQVASSEAPTTAVAARRSDHGGHAAPGRRADRVQFSNTAMEMSRALQAVTDAPDVREDRIAALRAAIEGGTYQIDPDGIAQGMAAEGLLS